MYRWNQRRWRPPLKTRFQWNLRRRQVAYPRLFGGSLVERQPFLLWLV